jgi:hypothetical protein
MLRRGAARRPARARARPAARGVSRRDEEACFAVDDEVQQAADRGRMTTRPPDAPSPPRASQPESFAAHVQARDHRGAPIQRREPPWMGTKPRASGTLARAAYPSPATTEPHPNGGCHEARARPSSSDRRPTYSTSEGDASFPTSAGRSTRVGMTRTSCGAERARLLRERRGRADHDPRRRTIERASGARPARQLHVCPPRAGG